MAFDAAGNLWVATDGLRPPTSRFPDGRFARPSVIAARKDDGGVIGS